jgi:hypothetical protein
MREIASADHPRCHKLQMSCGLSLITTDSRSVLFAPTYNRMATYAKFRSAVG